MTAENALPSQVTHAPGFQEPPSFVPQISDITPTHVQLLSDWQDDRFPEGEPLSRQGKQYKDELGEVGTLVFGLSPDRLDHLGKKKRKKIGDEISDVIISGVGKLKVLGFSYEDLKEREETAVYDSKLFSTYERWQIDANGRNIPVSVRLKQFAEMALVSHKAYDDLGTDDEGLLTDPESITYEQKKNLALQVTKAMTLGLSVLNGMGESFDKHFKTKLKKMEKKYPKDKILELRAQGLDDFEIIEICRRDWEARKARKGKKAGRNAEVVKTGEVILYSSMDSAATSAA